MVLMSIYALPNLPKNGSTSTLQDLLNIIICILVEPEVRQLPENSHLIRALNVLIVKMLDRSDHSRVTCAFIRLLKEFVGNPSLSREHSELVR
jgi:cytoskeleton-associated protein 5